VWPDRITPPHAVEPIVANRLALPAASPERRLSMPCPFRYSATHSISGRFERVEVVSNAISRSRMSSARDRRSETDPGN